MKMYNGYPRLARDYTLMVDEYEHTMLYGYLRAGKNKEEAVFDIFFRKIPNDGGYAIMAGVDKIIAYVESFNYGGKNLDYFIRNGYSKEYIDNLRKFKFTGDIYAISDGTPVFPNEPILTIKGPLDEIQVFETMFLSILNGAMSHATGARRIIESTKKGTPVYDMAITSNKEINWLINNQRRNVPIMEFGARRADGEEAAVDASLYGMMAGCVGTSNVMAADMVNKKAMGTMAHCFIETYPSEFEAFKDFVNTYHDKGNCILLVDTYDTLRSGVPNAIKTFNYMKENGLCMDHIGIRIDSGDLAYLSKEARKMMDQAGFRNATICLSNGLKAETIESLINQGAVFDSLGVGDNISKPEGNMGCVYKEVAIKEKGKWIPKIKLSNDTIKIINPDYKKLYRAYDKNTGYALADIMSRQDEILPKDNLLIVSPIDSFKRTVINNYRLVELQKPIFIKGKLVYQDKDIDDIKKYCDEQMDTLYPEIKRTMNPHEYFVDGTENYVNFKAETINNTKKLVKKI